MSRVFPGQRVWTMLHAFLNTRFLNFLNTKNVNDCANSLYISKVTTDQWQKLGDSFQVRGEGYQQDFLKTFFPNPIGRTPQMKRVT